MFILFFPFCFHWLIYGLMFCKDIPTNYLKYKDGTARLSFILRCSRFTLLSFLYFVNPLFETHLSNQCLDPLALFLSIHTDIHTYLCFCHSYFLTFIIS